MAGIVDGQAFAGRLEKGLADLQLRLDRAAIDRLYIYFRELKKWSVKVNLIARGTGDEQIIEAHFLDSLTLLPLLPEQGAHLLDIGSGAGFPGLVLKAARPGLTVTLVEPRLKRVSFLKHVIRSVGLADIVVYPYRAEDEGVEAVPLPFSHITSRAVTDIAGFLQLAARFAKPGVQVICMKGPKYAEELAAASQTLAALEYAQLAAISRRLPTSGAERTLLVFQRMAGRVVG